MTRLLRDFVNRNPEDWAALSPHTSLIHACYGVEPYLPEFLASLDAQGVDAEGYELLFIIDGSPDGSEAVVREWSATTRFPVRILVQENHGVAAARNAGLAIARGEWVSTPDPDDRLAPDYLQLVEEARRDFPTEQMFVASVRLRAPDGSSLSHPLDYKWRDGTRRRVDLLRQPDDIQPQGGTVFLSLSLIREREMTYNTRLPAASDSDFIMRYLLQTQASYVYLPQAIYFYQRRADDSSIVKTQEQNVERYRVVFGETHPKLLDLAGEECPQWLANSILYFVFYLFRRNLSADSPVYQTPAETLEVLRRSLTRNLQRIGRERIQAFRIFDVPLEVRAAWLAAADSEAHTSPVHLLRQHSQSDLVRIAWYEPLGKHFRVVGCEGTQIRAVKRRSVEFLGGAWVTQCVALVGAGTSGDVVLGTPTECAAGGPEDSVELGGGAPEESCEHGPSGPLHGLKFEPNGVASSEQWIRQALGQTRPLMPPKSRGRRVSTTGTAVEKLRKRIARLKWSVPLRLARWSQSPLTRSGPVLVHLGRGDLSRNEGWIRSLVRQSKGSGIWFICPAGSMEHAFLRKMHAPMITEGSVRHFIALKHARRLWSTRPQAVLTTQFPRELLSRTWQPGLLPVCAPAGPEHRTWNRLAGVTVVADGETERQHVIADGSYYGALPEEVLVAPGWRDISTTEAPGGHDSASTALLRAVLSAGPRGSLDHTN